jgi:predicted transcriptional regulator
MDSDASLDDDDSSDDDKTSKKKKALASITINNKPSLFDTPSRFMAKSSKVKYDESDDSECESDSDDNNKFSNEQLMDMLEQANSIISRKSKKCKDLQKQLDALE